MWKLEPLFQILYYECLTPNCQQNVIQEKPTELAKRELEVFRIAFEKEKELTDRALKLAEIGKPKPNWELQGLLGLAAFVLGFLEGK